MSHRNVVSAHGHQYYNTTGKIDEKVFVKQAPGYEVLEATTGIHGMDMAAEPPLQGKYSYFIGPFMNDAMDDDISDFRQHSDNASSSSSPLASRPSPD